MQTGMTSITEVRDLGEDFTAKSPQKARAKMDNLLLGMPTTIP